MNNCFVDTDIILDLLTQRAPYYADAKDLFSLIEVGDIQACTTPLIFANVYYVMCKLSNKTTAKKAIRKLESILTVIPMPAKSVAMALASNFHDFEDALQYFSLIDTPVNCLITRNKKDYKTAGVLVYTADEFLMLHKTHASQT